MNNKKRRNMLRLYKRKKQAKIVKYREVFDEKIVKIVQIVQKSILQPRSGEIIVVNTFLFSFLQIEHNITHKC